MKRLTCLFLIIIFYIHGNLFMQQNQIIIRLLRIIDYCIVAHVLQWHELHVT